MQTSNHSFADFHLILLGVEKWISDRDLGNYQLSDFTQLALNLIHARQVHRGQAVTVTHSQTLRYLTQNVDAIFDTNTEIPEDVDIVQIVDDGWGDGYELGDGVSEYLRKTGLDSIRSYDDFLSKDENQIAHSTYRRLDGKYRMVTSTTEQRGIESEYTEWRRFICENNVVNNGAMLFNLVWREKVRSTYYEPAHAAHHRIVYTEKDGAKVYLVSPTSGLLYKNANGEFVPIKWVAGFEGAVHANKIPVKNNDYILKQTHQKRILIPGIPEINLFRVLEKHPEVQEVRLFPGVDRYDLRVQLNTGEIHAIDIKTYRHSASLENKLKKKKDPKPTIDAHEQVELGFDKFLFLIPERYIDAKGYPQRLTKLRKLARKHDVVEVDTIENYLKEWFNVS